MEPNAPFLRQESPGGGGPGTLLPYVPELLASYERTGGLNNRDAHNMPSNGAVARICEDLLQLLFPDFHDHDVV